MLNTENLSITTSKRPSIVIVKNTNNKYCLNLNLLIIILGISTSQSEKKQQKNLFQYLHFSASLPPFTNLQGVIRYKLQPFLHFLWSHLNVTGLRL